MKKVTIKAISRASVKIKDSFYTFEYGEERAIDESDNIDEAKKELWDSCNSEVDAQIEDVVNMLKR